MGPGDSVHVSPKTVHRMTAIEDCDVFEVSTPELDDVVRLGGSLRTEGYLGGDSGGDRPMRSLVAGVAVVRIVQNGISSSVIGSIGGSSARAGCEAHRDPSRRRAHLRRRHRAA